MFSRIALLLLTLAMYGRAIRFDFINYDDPSLVYDNPKLNPPTMQTVAYYWSHRGMELFIPVTYSAWAGIAMISHTAVDGVFRLQPWGFHAANILCHACTVLLTFEILLRLFDDALAATVGAVLFAIHPLQVEPVIWATGLRDVLAGMLATAAVLVFLRSQRTAGDFASATLFTIGMLAKPSAIAALPIAAILIIASKQLSIAVCCRRLAPWTIAALVVLLITRYLQAPGDLSGTAFYLRPLIAADAVAFYLGKLCWPFSLVPVYPRRPIDVINNGWIAWTWIIPVVVAVIVMQFRRRWLTASFLVFVAGLLPTLGFVSFIYQRHSTVADRYAYIAMLGPAIATAWVVKTCPTPTVRVVIVIVLITLALRCSNQTSSWRNSMTLATSSLQRCPDSPMLRVNYGAALASEGQLEKADQQFIIALTLDPADESAIFNHRRAQSILARPTPPNSP